MRRISIRFLATAAVLATLVVLPVLAQTAPPRIIMVTQEHLKPGKMLAHEKMETAWTQASKKAMKTTPMALGLTPLAGPNEVWFLWGADSVAEMAKLEDTFVSGSAGALMQQYYPQESEFLTDSNSFMAKFEESLSTNPKVNWGEIRYMLIGTEKIRRGHDAEYAEYEKLLKTAREKAGITWSALIYQVFSGGEPRYLYIIPRKDLSLRPDVTLTPEEEKRKQEIVEKIFIEQNQVLFAISPGMSWATDEMVATAPDFWTIKPVMNAKKAPTTTTEAKKTTPKRLQ